MTRAAALALVMTLIVPDAGSAQSLDAPAVSGPTRFRTAKPNSAAVRDVVRALGTAKTADVTTTADRVRGKIVAIGDDWFEVSKRSSPVRIAYDDVREIKPGGMHIWTKVALISGVVIGAGYLTAWLLEALNVGS